MNPPNTSFNFQTPKNDIVWGSQEDKVLPAYQVKNSSKWMIWCGMTRRGLTALHFVPQGRTVTAEYYMENILKVVPEAKSDLSDHDLS